VQTAIAAAKSQRGVPYAWGGGALNGPSEGFYPDAGVIGFDCSSLVRYAYYQAGLSMPRTSREQYARFAGKRVDSDELQPGDLLFYASGSSYTSIYHVTMYIGSGQVIHAPQSGDVIRTSNVWFGSQYFGAVRPTG
jgi:cell wall-associated NlpC family hydrolase